jgi:hypothetical protein
MNEPFIVPVIYKGTEYELKARFERWEYTHRIAVLIDEVTIIFEPDERGAYRALSLPNENDITPNISIGLLQAVSEKLQKLIN